MSEFDVTLARAAFPALHQDQVFLDNAGGSQTLGTVIESIRKYLSRNNVQLGGSYPIGRESTSRYDAGEAAGAKYINASTDEIVFGSSTTQLFRNLSYTLQFDEGDELVLSQVDHEANIAPWVDLAARQKLTIKWWKPKDLSNPKLQAADLKELLSPRTRLVTCTHSSNILGSIHDIPAIGKQIRSVAPSALFCVDGVAYAPHRPIDVKALGVDFYCFSWYKVYGPHISMLYASREAQNQMRSLGHFFNPSDSLKDKLVLAGGCYELVQSIPEVVDYLAGRWDGMIAQEGKLQATLLEYLNSRPEVTIRGDTSADTKQRVATVAFSVAGWGPREFVEAVEEKTSKFGFRWGSFYSNRLVCELLGLTTEGVVRISMVHYSTVEEVQGVIRALDQVLSAPR